MRAPNAMLSDSLPLIIKNYDFKNTLSNNVH